MMKQHLIKLTTNAGNIFFALTLTLIFSLAPVTPVLADLSGDDVDAIYNNWPGWVVGDELGCSIAPAGGGPLVGKDNIAKAYNFFVSKGLTGQQAAGIVGNLRQESGVNPASHNTAARPSGPSPGSIIPGETWNGGGIAQWEGGRWTGPSGILNFVAGKADFAGKPQGDGKNWKDLGIQLDFIWGELSGTFPHNKQPGLAELKATTTVEQAAITFEQKFERAGTPNMPNRIRYANEVYVQMGGTAPPPASDTTGAADASTAAGCPAAGAGGGVDVNGYSFPLAPRTKKNYGTMPCNQAPTRYTDTYGKTTQVVTCHHDNSPAYDLMDGNGGSPVYAITNGHITKVNRCYSMSGPCEPGCMSIQFQANNGTDKTYYWYGHLTAVPADFDAGKAVTAGQQMATTATRSGWDSRCWGGGPHLHIDRGCIQNTTPHTGGNQSCRDPGFMADLRKIWEGLPAG